MNKKFTDYLENLDLSENEAKLYFTLLQTGPLSVRALAQKLEFKRTTTYHYADDLLEKGLIMKLMSGAQTLMYANQPEDILPHLVEQKVHAGKKMQETLPNLLTEIRESLPTTDTTLLKDIQLKYYSGKIGVKRIYEDALKSSELRSYVNITEIEKVFPENVQLFNEAFKNNPDIKMYEIVEDSMEARERFKTVEKAINYSYKFLPKDIRLTAQDILLFDDKVAIIHFKNGISGVIHYDVDLYNNFKLLFDYIWKTLPNEHV